MSRLATVHGLRGLAALAVVLFHAGRFAGGYGSGALPADLFRVGEAGVDVFFVISGLALTLATRRPVDRGAFIAGRLVRVGVPYWTVTLALAGMMLLLPSAFRSARWTAPDLLLSLAFIPSLHRDGALFPLLEPGWTLSLEMFFYGVLAVFLGLAGPARARALAAVLCGLAVAGAVLAPPVGPVWFYTQSVLVEFCVGIGIAHWLAGRNGPSGRAAALLLAAAALGFAAAAAFPPDPFGRERLAVYGLPATCLVLGAVLLEPARTATRAAPGCAARALAFLGEISYALYLTHVPALALLAKLVGCISGGITGDLGLLAVLLAGALAAAAAFHLAVERPAHLLARSLRRTAPAPGARAGPVTSGKGELQAGR